MKTLNGKRKCDIVREYDISSSLLDKWIKQSASTGSFKEKYNRSEEDGIRDVFRWDDIRETILNYN